MFFFPKKIDFFQLLSDLQKSIVSISDLLVSLSKDFKDFEKYAEKAKAIEHEADEKTHKIIQQLNKTFITPIDREDIYLLANELDDIVDLTENVIRNIHIYQITENQAAFSEFGFLIRQAADFLGEFLEHLQKGKHNEQLVKVKVKIHELEDRGDEVFENAISNLFKNASDAVKIIKLKDVLEDLESIMDKFQKTTDVIEGIIVKST